VFLKKKVLPDDLWFNMRWLFLRWSSSFAFLTLQITVAAAWDTLGVLLLRTFSVAVTTSAPHAARRLPAVDPNLAKALAILTLGQATFGLVGLYSDNYVAEARDLEDI
jgi:hypothetical protein